ncbi:hypothetical protein SanaruYs_11680 [Chryseotalea sanaruensis]|uniref:Uncharacterized protein n=1 Tax=Chryseotalea sanaruensis TaxID=2482724 RepID=A0A401U7S4_9BACT|nr:hypothetical protein [Chryseotalea sanaruensis]GCC50949.1 hypothetical protein SanaruYs_11680 [Chryseotalea sanaruensis]
MKIIQKIFIIMLLGNIACSFNNKEQVIEKFITDLKNNDISNVSLITKYYENQDKSQNEILHLLSHQIDLLRTKLLNDCPMLSIQRHDGNSDLVKSFKLKTEGYDVDNIFYIICNDVIITPVLLEAEKIKSISTYSKTETGSRIFVIL